MTSVTVPRSWSELTPSWLSAALADGCPGAMVASVRVGATAEGTNRSARVHLAYARGAGPAAVFVKLPGARMHRLALLALRALPVEARLAGGGVSFPLEHPRPYAAGVDPIRLASVVVTEDIVSSGGRPNVATTALTPDEVSAGLGGLARLHARYWNRPLPPELEFLRPWRLGPGWAPLSAASLAWGLHRLAVHSGGRLPVGASAGRLERQFRASAALARTGPQTILHGDPHPGNSYRLPGPRTGFYDWQLARTGHWSHDVGYFLVSALGVADRRAHDRELLAGYLGALGRAGIEPPGWDAAWARYRATPAFGLATWLHTLGGGFQPVPVCLATVERFAAAYRDFAAGPTGPPPGRRRRP